MIQEHPCNLMPCCIVVVSVVIIIGASLSEPHHVRSTVKSVFLLDTLPYMAKNCLSANQVLVISQYE